MLSIVQSWIEQIEALPDEKIIVFSNAVDPRRAIEGTRTFKTLQSLGNVIVDIPLFGEQVHDDVPRHSFHPTSADFDEINQACMTEKVVERLRAQSTRRYIIAGNVAACITSQWNLTNAIRLPYPCLWYLPGNKLMVFEALHEWIPELVWVTFSAAVTAGHKTPHMTEAKAKVLRKLWKSGKFRQNNEAHLKKLWDSVEYRKAHLERLQKTWANPEFRAKHIKRSSGQFSAMNKKNWGNPEFKAKKLEAMSTPEYKEKRIQGNKRKWLEDQEFRTGHTERPRKFSNDQELVDLIMKNPTWYLLDLAHYEGMQLVNLSRKMKTIHEQLGEGTPEANAVKSIMDKPMPSPEVRRGRLNTALVQKLFEGGVPVHQIALLHVEAASENDVAAVLNMNIDTCRAAQLLLPKKINPLHTICKECLDIPDERIKIICSHDKREYYKISEEIKLLRYTPRVELLTGDMDAFKSACKSAQRSIPKNGDDELFLERIAEFMTQNPAAGKIAVGHDIALQAGNLMVRLKKIGNEEVIKKIQANTDEVAQLRRKHLQVGMIRRLFELGFMAHTIAFLHDHPVIDTDIIDCLGLTKKIYNDRIRDVSPDLKVSALEVLCKEYPDISSERIGLVCTFKNQKMRDTLERVNTIRQSG
jgi:hypothetical protein